MGVENIGEMLPAGGIFVGDTDHLYTRDSAQVSDIGFGMQVCKTHNPDLHDNTSVKGAYMALLRRDVRDRIDEAAGKMTYLELSADNTFYEHFTSASFLPHTEIGRFPAVAAALEEARGG